MTRLRIVEVVSKVEEMQTGKSKKMGSMEVSPSGTMLEVITKVGNGAYRLRYINSYDIQASLWYI